MSKKPIVETDADGRFFVRVADGCRLVWWTERYGGEDHYHVTLDVPANVPILERRDGYDLVRPSRH